MAKEQVSREVCDQEAALANLVQAGDEQAFVVLMAHCEPMLRAQVAHFSPSGADAEDLAQEGLLGLLSAVRTFRADKGVSFRTYASVCVRNRLLSVARRRTLQADELLVEDAAIMSEKTVSDPATLLVERESAEQLLSRIRALLSAREYAVFLRYLNGESYAEIAAALQLTSKVVDNALQRARRKLQAAKVM